MFGVLLLWKWISLNHSYACFSLFTQDLFARRDYLVSELRNKKVSVVICPKFDDECAVKELLYLVAQDINVYPPMQCQMRSIDGIVSSTNDDNVVGERMSYIAQINTVMNRVDNRIASMRMLYQLNESCVGIKEIRYDMSYFEKDESVLTWILKNHNIPELRYDFQFHNRTTCDNAVIIKITFIMVCSDVGPMLDGNQNGWRLQRIRTWPAFDIDVPHEPIDENHEFYRVTEHLGQGIFRYLNYYGGGRYPI